MMWGRVNSIGLLFLSAMMSLSADSCGQSPGSYYRIMVPADQPESWPTQGQQYLPVDHQELRELLTQAQALPFSSPSYTIEHAQWWATFQQGKIVGTGRIDPLRAGTSSAFLPWDPKKLNVSRAIWLDTQQPISYGDWTNAQGTQFGALLNQYSPIELQFSVSAQTNSNRQLRYLFAPITGSTSTLTLDLPANQTPSLVQGGLLLEQDRFTNPTMLPALAAGLKRWSFALKPFEEIELVIDNPSEPALLAASPFAYRSTTLCTISEAGVQTQTDFEITPRSIPPSNVRVKLRPGWTLIGALLDGKSIAWSADAAQNSFRLPLTELSPRQPSKLRLECISDRPDGIALETNPAQLLDGEWLEGRVQVSVEPPLQIIDLPKLEEAVFEPESDLSPASAARQNKRAFQMSSENARISMLVAPASRSAQLETTHEVAISSTRMQAEVELRSASGSLHPLHDRRLHLMPGWQLQGVEASENLGHVDWEIEASSSGSKVRLNLPSSALNATGEPQRVRLQLSRPVQVGKENKFLASHLLGIQTDSLAANSTQLRITCSDNLSLELTKCSPLLQQLPSERGLTLVSNPNLPEYKAFDQAIVRATSTLENPTQCRILVRKANDQLRYRCEIRAQHNIQQLRFRPKLPTGTQVSTPENSSLSALLADPSQLLSHDGDEETLLTIPTLDNQSERVLQVSFKASDKSELAIPLPSISSAEPARGELVIRQDVVKDFSLDHAGLSPLQGANPADARLVFNLDSNRAESLSATLSPLPLAAQSPQQSKLFSLKTLLLSDGRIASEATLAFPPAEPQVELTIPSGCQLISAFDTTGSAIAPRLIGDQKYLFPNPSGNEDLQIRIRYQSSFAAWSAQKPLLPQLPSGVRIEAWTWSIATPQGLRCSLIRPLQPSWIPSRNLQPLLDGWMQQSVLDQPLNPLTLESWRAAYNLIIEPLKYPSSTAASSNSFDELDGWDFASFSATGTQGVRLQLQDATASRLHNLTVGIFTCLLFLLWPWRISRRTLLGILFVTWSCVLLPLPLVAPWAFAVASGTLLGTILHRMQIARWQSPSKPPQSPAALSRASTATFLILLVIPSACLAEDTHPASKHAKKILVPVDSEGKPAGSKWYVESDHLLNLRNNSTPSLSPSPYRWVLHQQRLQGSVSESEKVSTTAFPWTLRLQLSTFSQNASIQLPIQTADGRWRSRVLIDGSWVPLRWNPDETSASFLVEEPGRHSVEISLEPFYLTQQGQRHITLHLPPCSNSRLQISALPSTQVRLFDKLMDRDPVDQSVLIGDWTGSTPIRFRWQDSQSTPQQLLPSCSAMQWISVGTQHAELVTRWRVQGTAPLPRTLHLATSGNTLKIPPRSDWSAERTTLDFFTTEPIDRATCLGKFEVKLAQPTNASVKQRMIAAWLEEGLSMVPILSAGISPISTEAFVNEWGADQNSQTPQLAVSAANVQEPWKFSVRPTRNNLAISAQSLDAVLGKEVAQLRYEANLTPSKFPIGRLAIEVPEEFRLRSATIRQGELRYECNIHRLTSPSRVVLLCNQVATSEEPLVLRMRGATSTPNGTLPLVRIKSSETPLTVNLQALPGEAIEVAARQHSTTPLRIAASEAPPRFTIHPRPAKYAIRSLCQHAEVSNHLETDVRANVIVSQGQLAELPVQVTPPRAELVLLTPGDTTLVRSPTGRQGTWLIRFARPLATNSSSELSLLVRTPISSTKLPAAPVRFPESDSTESYVSVREAPLRGEWNLQGLSSLPAEKATEWLAPLQQGCKYFSQATSQDGFVKWIANSKEKQIPNVIAQEYSVCQGNFSNVSMVSSLLIDPLGTPDCLVFLPPEHKNATWLINGLAPLRRQVSDHHWRVLFRDASELQQLSIATTIEPDQLPAKLSFPSVASPNKPEVCLLKLSKSEPYELVPPSSAIQINAEIANQLQQSVLEGYLTEGMLQQTWWQSRAWDVEPSAAAGEPANKPTPYLVDPTAELWELTDSSEAERYRLVAPEEPTVRIRPPNNSSQSQWLLIGLLGAIVVALWNSKGEGIRAEAVGALTGFTWWMWLPFGMLGFCLLTLSAVAGVIVHRRRIAAVH